MGIRMARRLGRLAIASLHAELACDPKPGLVTPSSSGSHTDMDAATFLRSLFALRGYFVDMAGLGQEGDDFAPLRARGIRAEAAMLQATGGINTHRGAIFNLGLLVAEAARLEAARGRPARAEQVCLSVTRWRSALLQAPLDPASPGQQARRRHGVPGVREHAADGMPLLRGIGVPVLRECQARGLAPGVAHIQTLMHLVAVTDDLNLLHRGGLSGLRFAQAEARRFVAAGGVGQRGWRARLQSIGRAFQARRLSPGGSADLLACSIFLLRQERDEPAAADAAVPAGARA